MTEDERRRRRRGLVSYGWFQGGWGMPMVPGEGGHDCTDTLNAQQFGVGVTDAATGNISNAGEGATQ